MKILCLSPFAAAPTLVNRTLPILNGLRDNGHQIDIFLPHVARQLPLTGATHAILNRSSEIIEDRGHPAQIMRRIFRVLAHPSVGRLFFPLSGTDDLSVMFELLTNYSFGEKDYDIIYISKPWLRTSGPGLWLGRKWKIPVVLDMDDYDISQGSYLLRYFRGVVVSSRELQRLFKRHNPLYIPNSTDLDVFDPSRFPTRKHELCTILWSGIMYDYLRLENLLRALKEMKEDAVLEFSGAGPKKSKLIRFAQDLKIANKVTFWNWAGRQIVPQRLANADVGIVYTSETRYEMCKCPGKLFEYMAMKLPVVTTNVGEAATTIREANCGIEVPPNEPKTLARALDYLVKNPDVRKQMGENGREFLQRKQSYKILASRLEGYMDRVCSRGTDTAYA
jgi:glycosyltransferase involved in cell wall biosynthesis